MLIGAHLRSNVASKLGLQVAVYALATVVLRTAPLGVAAATRPDVADRGVALGTLPRLDSPDSPDSTGSTGSASERKERSLLARPLWLQHFIDVVWHPHFWYLTGPSCVGDLYIILGRFSEPYLPAFYRTFPPCALPHRATWDALHLGPR